MKPEVKEFQDDIDLISEVQALATQGVAKEDLFVFTHDKDRTDRIAEHANANQIGIQEEGLGTAVGNIFREKGDELREQLQQLGFSKMEAENMERKLDHGKIFLLVKSA